MSADADSHIGKWLDAEPWHRLLTAFEHPASRRPRQLLEAIGYELRQAVLAASDPTVTAAKLGWWREEWQALAAGHPRHPLTRALYAVRPVALDADAGAQWVAAAFHLGVEEGDADSAARLRCWQRFSASQDTVMRDWLPAAQGEHDARRHALALLVEQLPLLSAQGDKGRLPLPLSALAVAGVTRDRLAMGGAPAWAALAAYADDLRRQLDVTCVVGGSAYRRGQVALARRWVRDALADPRALWQGQRPPLRLRAVWSVWRAWRARG